MMMESTSIRPCALGIDGSSRGRSSDIEVNVDVEFDEKDFVVLRRASTK
jgi:hypothetical protein